MKFNKFIIGLAAVVALGVASVAPAKAVNVTFAQFFQAAAGNPFTFTNAGGASTFTVAVPVTFVYLVPNGYGAPFVPIAGTMTLSSIVSAPAAGTDQPMMSTNMVFTANTPVSGFTNLLTLSNSTGTISSTGGLTAAFQGSTPGNVVTFSSQFLDFSLTVNRAFALSFTSVQPSYSVNGNGYLDSFQASGTGTFSSDPAPEYHNPVPEPGVTATFAMGALGLFGLMFRARKRKDDQVA